ncbi:MAG: TlpA family protein disulfide reductase [Gammaproteobacteria bacterium]|nr:TlpA family protein disulfide reductase [Gammaproteobacteria bacterium]MYF38305.1 TlpA family protein disulfide reductase [Gammaproteobacteria bacterium]
MKKLFDYISLFSALALLVICVHANASIPYKIKGEVISELPEVSEQDETEAETDGDESNVVEEESETSTETPAVEPVNLSDAVLTISHEVTNDEGEVETTILLEEHFNGDFDYEGVIDEPTEVKITLKVSEDLEPMEIDTVIGTGRVIHFALLDNPGPGDGFSLLGTSSTVLNQKNKFTITGDLSFLGVDLDRTMIMFTWDKMGADGESRRHTSELLTHNNSFVIEGDTSIPQVADLYVIGSEVPGFFLIFDVVLEPLGEYTVSQLGDLSEEISVSSESGYHALLIDSWQQQEDYLALKEEMAKQNEWLQELIDSGAEDTDDADDKAEVVAVSTTPAPAEGCEDTVAKAEEEDVSQSKDVVKHKTLRSKIAAMKQDLDNRRAQAIKEVAKNHKDPMARYLAVRLNPWGRLEYSPRISILRELETVMEADFVSVHITPLIERMERSALKANNDTNLVVGQRVPEFSLANYDGEDVALFDLLGQRDLVLIDFWASWCGPCIADFPELKKLYSAYEDEGFEIVGVSIDDNMEDWKEGVDEHELPWVNLGELKDWGGPVAVSYGVSAIPKGYLVDSQGCIYEKNIRPAALKEFLVDRYGMDESLEEPEVETDDAPEVSS